MADSQKWLQHFNEEKKNFLPNSNLSFSFFFKSKFGFFQDIKTGVKFQFSSFYSITYADFIIRIRQGIKNFIKNLLVGNKNISKVIIIGFFIPAAIFGTKLSSVYQNESLGTKASLQENLAASSMLNPKNTRTFKSNNRQKQTLNFLQSFSRLNSSYKSNKQAERNSWLKNRISTNAVFPTSQLSDIYDEIEEVELMDLHLLELRDQHKVYLYKINGEIFYSICELGGEYSKIPTMAKNVEEYIKKIYPNSKDLLSYIFSKNFDYQDDHVLVKILRDAHHIKKEKGYAIQMPAQFNAIRTNNQLNVLLYTNLDFRIDPNVSKNYTVRSLFQERLNQNFINWVGTLLDKNPKIDSLLQEIFEQLQGAFDIGLQHELVEMNKFYTQFEESIDSE